MKIPIEREVKIAYVKQIIDGKITAPTAANTKSVSPVTNYAAV